MPLSLLGTVLAIVVGFVLGLLGGGGSILALPIFLYVFHVETKSAIAMSLAVVGMSAFVGFLGHWRQGSVNVRVAIWFGAFAMASAFVVARLTHFVPPWLQLALFTVFAFTAAIFMLRDSLKDRRPRESAAADAAELRISWTLVFLAIGVGALTSIIGAGGGFVIVPALVLVGRVPVKPAVGSSLLIIAMNAISGFVGYIGTVPIDFALVGSFTAVAAAGAIAGTRASRKVSPTRIKQGFAVLILVLGSYLIFRRISGL